MHSCIFRPRFWVFENFLGFLRFLWNCFWVRLCWFVVICSCIESSLHYNNVSCIKLLWVLIGLDWVFHVILLIYARHMFMHFSCIRSFISFFFWTYVVFPYVLSLSLSERLLYGTQTEKIYSDSEPFLRTSLRTSRPVEFIWNARSFCWILPTLLSLKSFRPKIGNLWLRDPRGVPSCLYRSFTLIYMALIPLCLNLLPHSEVHVS